MKSKSPGGRRPRNSPDKAARLRARGKNGPAKGRQQIRPCAGTLYPQFLGGAAKSRKNHAFFGKRVQKLTKKEKEIRASLEKQLKDCGADLLHYQELLDDYVFFFGMERKMQAAVKKQGLTVTAVSAAGKEYDKENPAIKAAALYNQRMLHILREMGLTTATCRPPETDGSGDLG
nr:MAG TPA: terminase small subunit [Caudoviricetes sp.]